MKDQCSTYAREKYPEKKKEVFKPKIENRRPWRRISEIEDYLDIFVRSKYLGRQISLCIIGGTQLGKSEFVTQLGPQFVMSNEWNANRFEEKPPLIHIQDVEAWNMPPGLKQLIQGQSFDYNGKYQKGKLYYGGAPCIFTLNYDLRQNQGLKEIPEERWLRENVIFVNLGETPLFLKEGEEDRLWKAQEMENWEDYGGGYSCPKVFEQLRKKLWEERKRAVEIIERIWEEKKEKKIVENVKE
ncbi:hypothetical protein BGX38DRAFT_1147098 [Terfezia claveryi]|nr:hypothetical protein BGX38DRAFT_1147098 [Terfezia claveryi]